MPKISIITPCYNSEKFVGRTIESVRAQTFADWEHIVVDDGSKDGSAVVVESLLGAESRLRLLRQANGGVANARNNGLKACSPESVYLLFLDADDCLEPRMLEVLVGYLDAHPSVGLAYCNYVFVDNDDRLMETAYFPRYVPSRFGVRQLPPTTAETPFVSIFCWAPVMESVSVLRRSVYERTPGWDETLGHVGEGVDLFLRFALLSEVHYVPEKLYRYRQHTTQATSVPNRVQEQERKVYGKWRNVQGLTETQQDILRSAWRFREGRLKPFIGLRSGTRHLRRGEIGAAAQFYMGAAKRYLASFIPWRQSFIG